MLNFPDLSLGYQSLAVAAAVVLGAFIGSVVNLLASKIEVGEIESLKSVLFNPENHCPACGSNLHARDMIPVVSWVINGARCRVCGTITPIRNLFIELLFAIFCPVALIATMGDILVVIPMLFFVAVLAVLAVKDAEEGYIPDSMVILGTISGLLLSLFGVPHAPFESVFGMLFSFAFMAGLARLARKVKGYECLFAGDVKMVAMIGTWMGLSGALLATGVGAMAAYLYAVLAARHFQVNPNGLAIRMGPFFAIGAVSSMWMSIFSGWKLMAVFG